MEKEGNGFFEDFAEAEMVPLASEQAGPDYGGVEIGIYKTF